MDSLCLSSGTVEADDAFFGGIHAGSNHGRGTDKTLLIFEVPMNGKRRPGYLHAEACQSVNGGALVAFAKACIRLGALLRSDGFPAYNKLSQEGFRHGSEVFDPVENPDHLKWLHTLISNANTFISGTYHDLGDDAHLQASIGEFCFRFNRPFWFDQLFVRTSLVACSSAKPFTRYARLDSPNKNWDFPSLRACPGTL